MPPEIKADDDDLVVNLEPVPEDFAPPERIEVEPAKPVGQLSPTVPVDDDIIGLNEPDDDVRELNPDARGGTRGDPDARGGDPIGVEEAYDDRDERLAAAEENARQAQAQRIWDSAQKDAEIAETRQNAARVGLNSLNERITSAQHALAAAVEANDVATQLQINQDMQSMLSLKGEIEQGLRAAPTREQILAYGRQQAQQALAASAPRGKVVGAGLESRNPLADRWSASNPWTRTHKAANAYVIAQSQKMAASGTWDPDSPGFYAELGKRVALAFPGLKVNPIQAGRKAPGRGQMRMPSAPSRSANGASGEVRTNSSGKRQYTLTAYDQATMRRHRLDPNNLEHRKAFADSRMESARSRQLEGA